MIEYRFGGWRFPSGHRHQWWGIRFVDVGATSGNGVFSETPSEPGRAYCAALGPLFDPCPTLRGRLRRFVESGNNFRHRIRIDLPMPSAGMDARVAFIESTLDELTRDCVVPIPGPWDCRANDPARTVLNARTASGVETERPAYSARVNFHVDSPDASDVQAHHMASALNVMHGVKPEDYWLVDEWLKERGLKPMEFRRDDAKPAIPPPQEAMEDRMRQVRESLMRTGSGPQIRGMV